MVSISVGVKNKQQRTSHVTPWRLFVGTHTPIILKRGVIEESIVIVNVVRSTVINSFRKVG